MPPRVRDSSGYRGVHARPSNVYYTEIRSGNTRLGLGTFETAHEAARAYDAAAWRLSRPQAHMNFLDVRTREQAQELAPPPQLITDEDRRVQCRQECRCSGAGCLRPMEEMAAVLGVRPCLCVRRPGRRSLVVTAAVGDTHNR
nr:ethylene-responsive transcription factor 5-like [Aegilops tauschii subsp. strangulata]